MTGLARCQPCGCPDGDCDPDVCGKVEAVQMVVCPVCHGDGGVARYGMDFVCAWCDGDGELETDPGFEPRLVFASPYGVSGVTEVAVVDGVVEVDGGSYTVHPQVSSSGRFAVCSWSDGEYQSFLSRNGRQIRFWFDPSGGFVEG